MTVPNVSGQPQQPAQPNPISQVGTWEPYVVVKPGGLSTTATTVNTILLFITCGWWAPIYFLMYLGSPIKRVDVMAPLGTDPRIIESMRQAAMVPTLEDKAAQKRRLISVGVVAGIGLAVAIFVASTWPR